MKVRTRYAPSPTGYAHIGFVSRVLINYALAKKYDGQFVWRNEDTDTKRFVPDSLEFNMRWMREFGLDWDEGPDKGGPYAPYNQSERLESYRDGAKKLIEKDYAYKCFCTKERLDALRTEQAEKKERPHYDQLCRNLSEEEVDQKVKEGLPYVVRLKVPTGRKIEFDDAITHNHITWKSDDVDDYILLKSDGYPTYHLAVVIDDMAMDITHAFRGTEWIATTPVHILVYEGFGVSFDKIPKIGHFTVLLDPATPGKKFSKRNAAFKANKLIIQGYLKPAVLNYLMLLGWAPKDNRELFTLEEFVEAFDLAGMQKANPTWDQKKIDWFNGVYARELSPEKYTEEFLNWISTYLMKEKREDIENSLMSETVDMENLNHYLDFAKSLLKEDKDKLKNILALVQERAVNFWLALQQIEFFYKTPEKIDWNIKPLNNVQDKLKEIKEELYNFHSSLPDDSSKWTHEEWEKGIRDMGDKYEKKHGDIFMILRVAVVGSPYSPPLFEGLQILGKEKIIERLK